MEIAILLFDRITALDAVGPYEVLARLPGAQVKFVALEPGEMRTETRSLALMADVAAADITAPDIVVIPGGVGTRPLMEHEPTLDWIRAVHQHSTWTTSVCTGSLLLA